MAGGEPPAKRLRFDPLETSKEYVVLLMLEEDEAFGRALGACREACDEAVACDDEDGASLPEPAEVRLWSEQREGTRHITLLKGINITPTEAAEVRYEEAPNLPLHLTPTRLMPWVPATIALGFDDIKPQLDPLVAGLQGLPATKKTADAQPHISLFRTGRETRTEEDKRLKKLAKRVAIPAIKKNYPRNKENTGVAFGSVRGVKVVIKPLGGEYDDSSWRVLASSSGD